MQCLGLFAAPNADSDADATADATADGAADATADGAADADRSVTGSPPKRSASSATATGGASAAPSSAATGPLQLGGFALAGDAVMRARKQAVMVGAGTALGVTVSFTPPAAVSPEDAPRSARALLRFAAAGGRVVDVLLLARPPRVAPVLPAELDVGLAAVGSVAYAVLPLHNPTRRTMTWRLSVPDPFDAAPTEGELAPGESLDTVVAFAPRAARTYSGEAFLRYDAGPHHLGAVSLQLNARAQYPYVSVVPDTTLPSVAGTPVPSMADASAEPVLDFGRVAIGRRVTRTVVLRNVSDVPAELEVEHSFLSVSHVQLTGHARAIPAGGSIEVRATYCPENLHERCVERFAFCVKNGNRVVVHCQGSAVTPRVRADG